MNPVLSITDLRKHFPGGSRGKPVLKAVDGVSIDIAPGETLGLVGESGCGKSTTGRMILRLEEPTSGEIRLDGVSIQALGEREMRRHRPKVQAVFQDPYSSLDPRMDAQRLVAEPLDNYWTGSYSERGERIRDLFERVGLRAEHLTRLPHEFSGGQRQRLNIARALSLHPKLIVCDEAVSALDVSIQAQVVNLLMDLQEEYGIAYLFIAHDLSVVEAISHRIAVMYLGRIVEIGPTASIIGDPRHPYTLALLSAVPATKVGYRRAARLIEGDPPNPAAAPAGCHFHPRCPYAFARCRAESPELRPVEDGHSVACHLPAPAWADQVQQIMAGHRHQELAEPGPESWIGGESV